MVPALSIPNHALSDADAPEPAAALRAVNIVMTGTWLTMLNVPELAITFSFTSSSHAVARRVYEPLAYEVESKYVNHGVEVRFVTVVQDPEPLEISRSIEETFASPDREKERLCKPTIS